ncbi:MAG: nuclear transport factor 2 family protein [Candidatus Sulfotelmatobacter sp.]
MKSGFLVAWLAMLTSLGWAQNPAIPAKPGTDQPLGSISADSHLKDMFESKIKAEWEALKNKDKKAYGDLLADDYEGVEVDGKGERTKIQALHELLDTNVANYTLWGYELIPLGRDAAFVIYESTIQFPPKSAVRYSRVYITELWVKRAGEWKELHYQETHVK